jgi:hypothetical protein
MESAMESDAPGISAPAPAATELLAGCSKRSSDIALGYVDPPSLEKKTSTRWGPLANAQDLVPSQEQFGALTLETTLTIQWGIES